jgi:hypothetical protein
MYGLSSMRVTLATLASGLALLAGAVGDAPARELPVGPVATFTAIERAWDAGDVDALLDLLSRSTVQLKLRRAGGEFPRPQIDYLIRDHFQYSGSYAFRVVEFEWEGVRDGVPQAPVAQALWVHGDEEPEVVEKLEIELRLEGDAWRIARIQSLESWSEP